MDGLTGACAEAVDTQKKQSATTNSLLMGSHDKWPVIVSVYFESGSSGADEYA
jgi:hypothetical protein